MLQNIKHAQSRLAYKTSSLIAEFLTFKKKYTILFIILKNDSGHSWTTLPLTCQGRSQSRGIGHAPTQAPIVAPCAGTQIANSNLPLGLQKFQMKKNQVISINNLG